jgi:dTDP-4-amino-4,6-dideoxygalactose transaminase
MLKGLPGIALPPGEDADKRPVYHCYVILTEGRGELTRHLADRGIATAVHYPIPIHRQAAYAEKGRGRYGDLPVSEMLSQRVLSLPMFPSMTDDQVRRVCEAVQSFGE